MTAAPKRLDVHTRATFVRDSVETIPLTDHLIEAVMPYFPRSARVIGGHVDEAKQFWKANFHWEYLLLFLDRFLAAKTDAKYLRCAKAIRAVLARNAPNPPSGYTASKRMGQPRDTSTREVAMSRWRTVRQCKKDFKRVLEASKLLEGMATKARKAWLLAVAPVAMPGRSKHSTGYALDLYGANAEIGAIARGLGASLVFPEGSHVHVEWADGVAGRKYPAALLPGARPKAPEAGDASDMCLMSPAELARLREETRKAPVTGAFGEAVRHLEVLAGILEDRLGEDWW